MSQDRDRPGRETVRGIPSLAAPVGAAPPESAERMDVAPVPVEDPAFESDDYVTTERHSLRSIAGQESEIQRFRLVVVEGPAAGRIHESTADGCSVGSHPLNDLVLEDAAVSRFHCEIRLDADGARICDLNSSNGTFVDGVQVREAFLRAGSLIALGRATLRFEYGVERNRLPVSASTRFGGLRGASLAMRATFALLERAAASDVTVLLEGETGTGKGRAAEGLHQKSARRAGPFVVLDCGAIPASLLESELFGHERGAFTGAEARRVGAFEDAAGGTIFLDEIGELPSDLQPKLLRALESHEIRRIGSNRILPVDVRVVAATNRDLRSEVNAGRFRSDLYYRLAVVKITMPRLRDRLEDIPGLVEEFLDSLDAGPEERERLLSPPFLLGLQRASWPGNVRELRNHVERCLVFQDADTVAEPAAGARMAGQVVPYPEAKRRAQADWERRYLEDLLTRCHGKVALAAEAAGVGRVYLYRLLRRHGLTPA